MPPKPQQAKKHPPVAGATSLPAGQTLATMGPLGASVLGAGSTLAPAGATSSIEATAPVANAIGEGMSIEVASPGTTPPATSARRRRGHTRSGSGAFPGTGGAATDTLLSSKGTAAPAAAPAAISPWRRYRIPALAFAALILILIPLLAYFLTRKSSPAAPIIGPSITPSASPSPGTTASPSASAYPTTDCPDVSLTGSINQLVPYDQPFALFEGISDRVSIRNMTALPLALVGALFKAGADALFNPCAGEGAMPAGFTAYNALSNAPYCAIVTETAQAMSSGLIALGQADTFAFNSDAPETTECATLFFVFNATHCQRTQLLANASCATPYFS